jgi:dUTPase
MKIKIKVKVLTEGCMPELNNQGDWIDLRASEDLNIIAPQAGVQKIVGDTKLRNVEIPVVYIPLGVAIELPKGYEAIIASRSGSPKKLRIFIKVSISSC